MSERPTPETDNLARGNHVVPTEWAEQLERKLAEAREKAERYRIKANAMMMQRDEARESLKHIGEYGTEEINAAIDLRQKLASALVERDDAQKELSSIYRWIERNHADGFIDSLTYLKNLERVMDCWYDRLDKIERERDEAREEIKNLQGAYDDATNYYARIIELIDERDEAREKYTALATENMLAVNKLAEERDEALAQVKELIYISDRAIALAEIDFENDKFGVVSELRDGLEKIKGEQ